MASKKILAQLELQEVSSLTSPASGFVGFSAKPDGLYQKIGTAPELRLLTSADVQNAILADGSITGAVSQAQIFTMGVKLSNLTQGYIPYASGTTKLLSNSPIYTDGTNIGIGTTAPGSKLDINGNVRIMPVSSSWAEGLQFYMPTTSQWGGLRWSRGRGNSDGNWYVGYTALDASDDLVFGLNNGGGQVDNIIRLVKNGNVGIGTANPGYKLDVNGTYSFNKPSALVDVASGIFGVTAGASQGVLFVPSDLTTNNGYFKFSFPDGNSVRFNSDYDGHLSGGKLRDIQFGSNAAINMIIKQVDGSGNVGIGTTNPSARLEINDDTSWGWAAKIIQTHGGAGQGLLIESTDGGNGGDVLKVVAHRGSPSTMLRIPNTPDRVLLAETSGNVGIGTTNPGSKLDLGNNVNNIIHVGGSGTDSYIAPNYWDTYGTDFSFNTHNAYNIIFNPQGTGNSIFANGNVGIGTAEPQATLNVYKAPDAGFVESIRIGGTYNYPSLSLGINGSYTGWIGTYGNDLELYAGNWRTVGSTATEDHAIRFYTSKGGSTNWSTAKMVLNADGNVGIGTKDPNDILTVSSPSQTLNAENPIIVSQVPGYTRTSGIYNTIDTLSGLGTGILFKTYKQSVGTYNAMKISHDGNVGIGTTDPLDILHIAKTNGASILISDSTNGTYPSVKKSGSIKFLAEIGNANNYYASIESYRAGSGYADQTDLRFFTHNSGAATPLERMRIADSGYVGIGTPAPNQQLEITKNFRLPLTTGTTPYGIIYKGTTPFIHDFNYGNNGTVTTSGNNTFIGLNAGNFTMGSTATQNHNSSYNTGIGVYSLFSNTIGNSNTAIGCQSLYNNTTGYNNIGIGYPSLFNNTTGYNNAAIGVNSLFSNTTGYNNAAIGLNSLFSNDVGDSNCAIGVNSLYNNTTGYNNTAIGFNAGSSIANGTARITGNNGLYLGFNSKASNSGTNNEIVIGYDAIGAGSNKTVIGNSSVTDTYFGSSTGASKLWASALNLSSLTASKVVFTDGSKNLTSTGIGTSSQFIKGDGSLDSNTYMISGSVSGFVPYNGATADVNVGSYVMYANNFILNSDARLKCNIELIESKNIDIDYKKYEFKSAIGNIRYGVIAQDLLKIAPEFVDGSEDSGYSVKYIDLLIHEIAYLKQEIKKLTGGN